MTLTALTRSFTSALLLSAPLLACVLIGGTLAGCGKGGPAGAGSAAAESGMSVKEQCNALNKANDTWSKKLTDQKDTNDATKDAQAMAKNVEDWAAAVGKVSIEDAGLKKLATEEQTVLKDMAGSLKELTGILVKLDDKKAANLDEKALDALQKQMESIEKKQEASQKAADAMDDKIEKYCADK